VTHLGQRLSALIDGELDSNERERVLRHVTKCEACREEFAALHTLKRRMSALGDAAAGAGLTGRLIGLSARAALADPDPSDRGLAEWDSASRDSVSRGSVSRDSAAAPPPWPARGGESPWPARGGESPWPARSGEPSGRGQASTPEQRAGRYFLAGSLAVFLAGLGTAAFIAGSEPQPLAPTPPVAPSVDVMVFGHGPASDLGGVPTVLRPSRSHLRRALSAAHTPRTGA
jgi:anti-sigma factor RsiW